MNGYVTELRFNRVAHLPIVLAQTELKAGKSIFVASFTVALGQRVEVRTLTLNLVRVLTGGVVPLLNFPTYRTCSIGIYRGLSDCSPLAFATVEGNSVTALNSFRRVIIDAPGEYRVIARNNSINVDLSIAATGALKLYS